MRRKSATYPGFKIQGGDDVVDEIAILFTSGAPLDSNRGHVGLAIVALFSEKLNHFAASVVVQDKVAKTKLNSVANSKLK